MNKNNCPTAHISAMPGEFAKTVLMPGDPLRARLVAEKFLVNARLINNVRGVQGYTGLYNGKEVSVMASGMGMPSMGIYSYELYNFYNVESIIRIGSAGAMQESIKLRDIVLGQGACTDSAYSANFNLPGMFSPICDFSLLSSAVSVAEKMDINYHVGNILSSDVFYGDDPEANARWRRMGVMAVEMEAAALYMNAARAKKKALAICTISDSLITGEKLSSSDREKTFTQMIELALAIA